MNTKKKIASYIMSIFTMVLTFGLTEHKINEPIYWITIIITVFAIVIHAMICASD